MDQIEPDSLYDERGDTSRARPLFQGDVFSGVVLPGFGDEPHLVQVVAHPCAMRRGADLTERITVAPVVRHPKVTGRGWSGNLRVMPLPALIGEEDYATAFVDVTAAPAGLLARERRIATLTNKGIYVLQQRLTKHYTRLELGLELFRKESAPVIVEAELQRHWLEEVLTEDELHDDAAIDAEAAVFDTWLSQGNPVRRALLNAEVSHSEVRRQCFKAAQERAVARHV